MSYTFPVSDEEHTYLAIYAKGFGQTAEELFQKWADHFADLEKLEASIFGAQGDQEEDEELFNDPLDRMGDGFSAELSSGSSTLVNGE